MVGLSAALALLMQLERMFGLLGGWGSFVNFIVDTKQAMLLALPLSLAGLPIMLRGEARIVYPLTLLWSGVLLFIVLLLGLMQPQNELSSYWPVALPLLLAAPIAAILSTTIMRRFLDSTLSARADR